MKLGLKRIGLVSVLCLASALVAGCGGDDDDDSNNPQPSGGKGGNAGAAGTAGKGGGAGTGGTAGSGGSSGAGAGGDSGAGGDAGSGGSSGAGAGGTSGSGGSSGSTGAVLPGPSRGSPIALSPDDTRAVVVNRDVGTVSVMAVDYSGADPAMTKLAEIGMLLGSEPWQAAVHPDGNQAFVVLRGSRKLVRIDDLKGTPKKGAEVAVGSEPTGLALTPTGAGVWVTSWVDGTVVRVDSSAMTVTDTVDLNDALVKTGLLGSVTARPALAHPRSAAITNNGNTDDSDETLVVTEYFAQRTAPEGDKGANADTSKQGLVYLIKLSDKSVSTAALEPFDDIGFPDHKNGKAGCFPNQLQSVTINGNKAYVVSICASPEGPLGVFAGPSVACTNGLPTSCPAPAGVIPTCTAAGACSTQCDEDSDCGTVGGKCDLTKGVCAPNITDVKTTTQPAVHVVDLDQKKTIAKANLNAEFDKFYAANNIPDDGTRRYPLVADDLAFIPNAGVAYLSANGADAVFRVVYDNATGQITQVSSPTDNKFINLHTAAISDAEKGGRTPVGIAITNLDHGGKKNGFTANDTSRDVSIIDFNTQAVSGTLFASTSDDPAPGSPEDRRRRGKRFFNTGLGRWSLKGQGWGACQSCHTDGLTDNVSWYFARGPRQSVSLDGSFAKKNPKDQRLFNWSAIFDEVADFEGNTRGTSGGVGAVVKATSTPPVVADRIDPAAVPHNGANENHAGLNGAIADVADPANPIGIDTPGKLEDWANITAYIQAIRSPAAPTNLDPKLVSDGLAIFKGGNCQGCHGGDKWTISKVFYDPSVATNAALKTTAWTKGGLPSNILPSTDASKQFMRAGDAANDQIQCILRNVGTFGNGEAEVGVAEVRADMSTPAQGNADNAKGFNPPSLLNLSTGAPYYHAGNARTLEAAFADGFHDHHQALSPNFLIGDDGSKKKALIHFLLSIDGSTQAIAIPDPASANGGDVCKNP